MTNNKNQSILLLAGNIIDHKGNVHEKKNILIKDGMISYIGKDFIEADIIYNCQDRYISPSFVNLHTHSPMNIFKGIAEDVNIDQWFNDIIWPYESKLEPEDIFHSSMVAGAEMLGYGVSAYADHYFYAEEVIKAALSLGIKIDMAPTLFSLDGSFDKGIENTIRLVKLYKNSKDVKISLGPHSPYTCYEEDLAKVGELANKYNLKIHTHVSETKEQVETSLKEKGVTPIELLYRVGCLKGKTILGHGLYITDEDISFINENTNFALSPKTYLKLNMGFGNILRLKDGLNITIGTDGAASSSNLNPLEQVRLLGLMGKFILDDPTGFDVKTLWQYLMKGHEVLEFNSGKIEEGYSADLLIWDLDLPNTQSNNNPIASIIYSSDPRNIESILISGKFVKKIGETKININNSINYCKNRINQLIEEGGGNTNLKF